MNEQELSIYYSLLDNNEMRNLLHTRWIQVVPQHSNTTMNLSQVTRHFIRETNRRGITMWDVH